jgi:hypothetical protein
LIQNDESKVFEQNECSVSYLQFDKIPQRNGHFSISDKVSFKLYEYYFIVPTDQQAILHELNSVYEDYEKVLLSTMPQFKKFLLKVNCFYNEYPKSATALQYGDKVREFAQNANINIDPLAFSANMQAVRNLLTLSNTTTSTTQTLNQSRNFAEEYRIAWNNQNYNECEVILQQQESFDKQRQFQLNFSSIK